MRKMGRFFLEDSTMKRLGSRQARWTVGAAVASVALASSSAASIPELTLVPVGVGIACAYSGAAALRCGVVACGVGAA